MDKCWLTNVLLIFLTIFISRISFAAGFPAKEIYEQASKNTVLIVSKSQYGHRSFGSGSIISPSEGFVLTNAHVVLDEESSKVCPEIKVFLKPDKVTGSFKNDLLNGYTARVLKYSPEIDLALLSLSSPPSNMGRIELADPDEIKIGEEVIAIGHPEQGGLWSLTYGRISGSIENFSDIPGKDVFQTDTNLNRGNSGGPLLDQRGYMVAVNSNIARLSSDNLPITGVNFAIKSSVVRDWLNKEGYTIAYGQGSSEDKMNIEKVQTKVDDVKIAGDKETKKEEVVEESSLEEKTKEDEKPLGEEGDKKKVVEESSPKEKTKEEANLRKEESQKEIKPEKGEIQKQETSPHEKFQTPERPYNYEDLFKAVEADLEDMIEEMRNKIRAK